MGNELVVRGMPLAQLGAILVKSGFFADVRQEAQAVVKVLAGQELGFGPVASMTGIHIIKGKPAVGAGLMAAAVKRSGKYNYRIQELTDRVCSIEFLEHSENRWESVGISTFTWADAQKAGTQNLQKFPRNMLFARAMSNGAKWFCPDLFGGPIYTPEELGTIPVDDDVIDMPVQEAAPPPPALTLPQTITGGVQEGFDNLHPAHPNANGTPVNFLTIGEYKGRVTTLAKARKIPADKIKSMIAEYGVVRFDELQPPQADELLWKVGQLANPPQPPETAEEIPY